MPHVINGVGTWYYGRSRIHRLKAGCEFCNRIGELTSYDTTLYFVVLFIPVIPLSKKRVLDECPSCRRHRVIAWKTWEKQKEEGIASVLQQLAEKPDDHEALGTALGIVTMYQDEPLFERIAELAKNDTELPKLQFQLANAYSYFGRREEAEAAYQHALRNDDSPTIRKSAALNALRMGEPERAEKLLDYVLKQRVDEDFSFIMLVIDAYQSFGRHEEALALIDRRDEAFPDLKSDKNLVKQRKQSEKYLGTGKKLNTANLVDSGRAVTAAGGKSGLAKWIFPLILIAALIAYLGSSFWIGSHQKIHLVNGTNTAYQVTVNGQNVNLPAMRETLFRVPEGAVEVVSSDSRFEPIHASIESNFWSRPFRTPVFVFNPDRVALIADEQTTYSKTPHTDPMPTFYLGESYYHFAPTDYAFEPFPASMKIKGSGEITKHRIGLEPAMQPLSMINYSMSTARKGAPPIEVVKRLSIAYPDEPLYITLYTIQTPPEEALALLKTGLNAKPLRVEWHRVYQGLIEKVDPKHDLVKEYQALQGDGNNGDAKYLLARVMIDGDESDKILQESIETNPPSVYGLYAMGFRALARADYPNALKFARKACESRHTNFQFQKLLGDALWANGEYKEYATLSRSGMEGYTDVTPEEYRAAVASRDREQMKSLQARKNIQPPSPNQAPQRVLDFDTLEAITKGDIPGFIKSSAKTENANGNGKTEREYEFYRALLEKKLDQAERILNSHKDQTFANDLVLEHGLLALAAYKAGQIPLAEAQAKAFAEVTRTLSPSERRLMAMVKGKEPFDLKYCLRVAVAAEQKRIVLAILAYQHPDQQAELRKLSKELDVQKDTVSLVLSQCRE
ncbi:MAG: tetratricopeptide repeat protein [Gemmataceae bacterium]